MNVLASSISMPMTSPLRLSSAVTLGAQLGATRLLLVVYHEVQHVFALEVMQPRSCHSGSYLPVRNRKLTCFCARDDSPPTRGPRD